ncbi:MAG: Fic family protein [Gammaproteobacteria bacterium]|nr:MAG: Fic family protein [Gammaproteobacteria bacterium]
MKKIADIFKNNQFETTAVFKKLNLAHRYLGELKGLCNSLPNHNILIDTLTLQEAQDSSEIENIITTTDEIYKTNLQPSYINPAAKEVLNYATALKTCYNNLQNNNFITLNTIITAQQQIKKNNAGVRIQMGTVISNEKTGQIIYTPPPPNEIQGLLNDLEKFINDDELYQIDPLIKMAIIHHQFESIHPFYDGNGRIGRIINIVYLVQQGLLETPILYLSRFINHNKDKYYHLLQNTRDGNWQDYILFMLQAVITTSQNTIRQIKKIVKLQQEYKNTIRTNHKKIYSQDLLNNIFKHPYTKINFLKNDLSITRLTASRYLDTLCDGGLLLKEKLGKENYYINFKLIKILTDIQNMQE